MVASDGPWPGAGNTKDPRAHFNGGNTKADPNTINPIIVEKPTGDGWWKMIELSMNMGENMGWKLGERN